MLLLRVYPQGVDTDTVLVIHKMKTWFMDYGGEHRHQYKGAFVVITNPFVPEKLKHCGLLLSHKQALNKSQIPAECKILTWFISPFFFFTVKHEKDNTNHSLTHKHKLRHSERGRYLHKAGSLFTTGVNIGNRWHAILALAALLLVCMRIAGRPCSHMIFYSMHAGVFHCCVRFFSEAPSLFN